MLFTITGNHLPNKQNKATQKKGGVKEFPCMSKHPGYMGKGRERKKRIKRNNKPSPSPSPFFSYTICLDIRGSHAWNQTNIQALLVRYIFLYCFSYLILSFLFSPPPIFPLPFFSLFSFFIFRFRFLCRFSLSLFALFSVFYFLIRLRGVRRQRYGAVDSSGKILHICIFILYSYITMKSNKWWIKLNYYKLIRIFIIWLYSY